MFAEIILNKTAKELNKTFDYIIPHNLKDIIKLGDRVIVPFGRGTKLADGIVVGIKTESKFANKEILDIKNSYLSKKNVEFAKIMARRYFCNDFDCIKLMLPPGTVSQEIENWMSEKEESFVCLNKTKEEIENDINNNKIKSEKHKLVLNYLLQESENKFSLAKIIDDLGVSRSIFKTIEKNGYIRIVKEVVKRNPLIQKNIKRDKECSLTDEQQYSFFRVNECIQNNEFQEFLLYGVTGSRKNGSLFATYTKCIRKGKKCYCFSSRNFAYGSNC